MKRSPEAFVSSYSSCTSQCRTLVCFFAGILTYRNNFDAAAKEAVVRYPEAKIVMIFPYGTANDVQGAAMTRLLLRQLTEVRYDLSNEQSRRVTNIVDLFKEHASSAENIIFIGHSAGGVIAYRTGLLLEQIHNISSIQVFAVGTPKFHLKDIPFNDRFTYITGQNRDRVTEIGRWRKRGSSLYCGKPKREIQLNFNPVFQGWQFHATYFLKSIWTDANQILHTNSEDLITKIHEIYPGT